MNILIFFILTMPIFNINKPTNYQASICQGYVINSGNKETCKKPTGCQYGDSVPMEFCDKFAPDGGLTLDEPQTMPVPQELQTIKMK